MKKIIAFMLILALSLSLAIFTTSCKSCNDNSTVLPGGVENPGDGFGGGDGNDNTDGSGNGSEGGWVPVK